MTARTLTERGTFAGAVEEGVVPCRYFDLVKVPTVFIGHTAAAGDPHPSTVPLAMPSTRAELDAAIDRAFRVFENDLRAYAGVVDQKFGRLEDHERDGWTLWHFNTGGAYNSSAVRLWRAGDKAGAVRVLRSWNKVTIKGQKVVSGALVKRRGAEANMILKGVYPAAQVPVWPTDGKGTVLWKAIDLLDFEEVRRIAFDAPPETFFARLWERIRDLFDGEGAA